MVNVRSAGKREAAMDPPNRDLIYDILLGIAIIIDVMIRCGDMQPDDFIAPLLEAAKRASTEQRRYVLAALAGVIAKGFPETTAPSPSAVMHRNGDGREGGE
jgi:hypothetical protein